MSWHWSPSCTKDVKQKCYIGTYRSMSEYCDMWNLSVNTDKTKIVIFF